MQHPGSVTIIGHVKQYIMTDLYKTLPHALITSQMRYDTVHLQFPKHTNGMPEQSK